MVTRYRQSMKRKARLVLLYCVKHMLLNLKSWELMMSCVNDCGFRTLLFYPFFLST